MSRNGKQGARQRDGQPEIKYITDILKRGEAQRDKRRVNNAVKEIIKFRIPPCAEFEKQKFCSFLHDGDDEKRE